LGCNTTKKKENGQMADSQEPGLSYQSTTTPYGTHSSVTVLTSNKDTKFDQGADHTAYHPEDVHILHAHPPKSNHDHDIIGPDDEAEYKYIKHAHISKNVTAIAHATGLKKLGGMHVGKSGLVVLIFVATLFAAGVMPITVTWAKGSTGQYPFLVSWWMVCFKALVVVISVLMAAAAGAIGPKPGAPSIFSAAGFKFGVGLLPPALLYTICDLLAFPILAHTDSATYATLTQLKIVVVALLFKFVLGRHVSLLQWIAVIELTLAALLYKIDVFTEMISGGGHSDTTGIVLILLKVLLASIASVWCDWSFKRKGPGCLTFPQQQIYFCGWMEIIAILNFMYNDGGRYMRGEVALFDGWSFYPVLALVVFASYGMLVSLFVKYLDSLTKLIMNLMAIILTATLSVHYFATEINGVQYFSIFFIILAAIVFKLGTVKKKKAE